MSGLAKKNVVLGVTGGIAAYKAAELCRLLVKSGARVRVVMTDAAKRFIGPLTMQTLSGAPVADDLFAETPGGAEGEGDGGIGHIQLGDEADVIVVAPATADTIARLAGGRADDLLGAVILASRAPVLLAPAMNVNMWGNPLTQQNLGKLVALGRFRTVGPDAGELACGWVGEGRLIDPTEILAAAERLFVKGPSEGPLNLPRDGAYEPSSHAPTRLTPQDLLGRKIVVTAGPTFEPIDDVRFIGNRSSGKMGFALAAAAARRGAEVTLIAGPVALATPIGAGITRRDVETAEQMRAALAAAVPGADAIVMAAAVGDFRPVSRAPGKLSRRARPAEALRELALVANPDLLAELGRARVGGRPLLIGFAAETGGDGAAQLSRARAKLVDKGCDAVVLNDVGAPGIGFGGDDNAVTLLFADGAQESLPRAPKTDLADALWDRLAPKLRDVGPRTEPARRTRRATVMRPVIAIGARGRGRRG
ncbi:MAG TPA: bifunctional phosphopantothenoylcysteine decarboxylase/phosphopantothenate synthase [Polyangia bacterium]|jgi:phosphopantothenoylcysteine decarboxylase/phosphopantothenate--cysteine ligase